MRRDTLALASMSVCEEEKYNHKGVTNLRNKRRSFERLVLRVLWPQMTGLLRGRWKIAVRGSKRIWPQGEEVLTWALRRTSDIQGGCNSVKTTFTLQSEYQDRIGHGAPVISSPGHSPGKGRRIQRAAGCTFHSLTAAGALSRELRSHREKEVGHWGSSRLDF